jgi:hypothetical protein
MIFDILRVTINTDIFLVNSSSFLQVIRVDQTLLMDALRPSVHHEKNIIFN